MAAFVLPLYSIIRRYIYWIIFTFLHFFSSHPFCLLHQSFPFSFIFILVFLYNINNSIIFRKISTIKNMRITFQSWALLDFVDVEFCQPQEEISKTSLTKFCPQSVWVDEILEVLLVSHFSKVNCAEIFEHWLNVLHESVDHISFRIEGQQEVYFPPFGKFSFLMKCLLLAI